MATSASVASYLKCRLSDIPDKDLEALRNAFCAEIRQRHGDDGDGVEVVKRGFCCCMEFGEDPSARDEEIPRLKLNPTMETKEEEEVGDKGGEHDVQKLLKKIEEYERKQKKLEKQLQDAGIKITEDIPYDVAKAQVEKIAKRMSEIETGDGQEYFKLERDFEKYNSALMLTDEWIQEQEAKERKWEEDNAADNQEALKKLRRHMPVNVKSLSETQLSSDPTPNNKVLPKAIAKKFKRTNVLQLIRVNPDDIVRMHPSTLEQLRVIGMTLTERRAVYAHIQSIGPRWEGQSDPMTDRKLTWFKMMKRTFRDNLDAYQRHVAQYGPPGNHPYATRERPNEGCPFIGRQCPLKADKVIDYDGDYGYPDEAKYEESNLCKSDTQDASKRLLRGASELSRGESSTSIGET